MSTQDWSWQRYADDPSHYRMDGASFHAGLETPASDLVAHEHASHPEVFEPDYLDWRARQLEPHDASYRRWRALEVARHDDLYRSWREHRRSGFHAAFENWRASQLGRGEGPPLDAASVRFEPSGSTDLSDISALDMESSQIKNIADGGAGHATLNPLQRD